MGLDMYLFKVKKQKNKKFEDILDLARRFDNREFTEKTLQEQKPYIFLRGLETGHYIYESYFDEEGYWRKANAIHKWFVENVQDDNDDCGYYLVSKDNVIDLLNICKEVKDSLKDKQLVEKTIKEEYNNEKYTIKVYKSTDTEIAEELLPTQEGFFFGDTEYDEYYLQDIEMTIEILEKVLKDFDFKNNYLVYSSSW